MTQSDSPKEVVIACGSRKIGNAHMVVKTSIDSSKAPNVE